MAAAKANGKWAGFLATDETWARDYWQHGFRVMAYGIDNAIYQAALKAGIDTLKSLA